MGNGEGEIVGQCTTSVGLTDISYYRNKVWKKGNVAYIALDAYSSTGFQISLNPNSDAYFKLPDGIRPVLNACETLDANQEAAVNVNGGGTGSSSASGTYSKLTDPNYGAITVTGKIKQTYSSAYYWKRFQITGMFPCEE